MDSCVKLFQQQQQKKKNKLQKQKWNQRSWAQKAQQQIETKRRILRDAAANNGMKKGCR